MLRSESNETGHVSEHDATPSSMGKRWNGTKEESAALTRVGGRNRDYVDEEKERSGAGVSEPTTEGCIPFIVMVACFGGLGGLVLGYEIGTITGALQSMEDDFGKIEGSVKGVLVAALTIGQIPGALVGGYVADKYGRKPAIFVQSMMYLVGGVVLTSAVHLAIVAIGRFIVGMGLGFSVSANIPWMSESCEEKQRGAVTSVYELLVTVGVLLGYIVYYVLEDVAHGWRYMFAWSMVLALPQCALVFVVPESPKWTSSREMIARRDSEIGIVVTRNALRQRDTNEDDDTTVSSDAPMSNARVRLEDWKYPLFVQFGLLFFAFFTGGINVRTFAPDIYKDAGLSDHMASTLTVVLGGIKVASTLLAVYTVDRIGRKKLLMSGLTLALLASTLLVTIAFVSKSADENGLCVAALCLYVVAYQISFGPCLFVVGSEMFPSIIRGKMMSLQILFGSLCDATSTETFSVLLDEFGLSVPFAGHFCLTIAGLCFVHFCFVETAEKSPEQIRDELNKNTALKCVLNATTCGGCACMGSSAIGKRVVRAPFVMARKYTAEFTPIEDLPWGTSDETRMGWRQEPSTTPSSDLTSLVSAVDL